MTGLGIYCGSITAATGMVIQTAERCRALVFKTVALTANGCAGVQCSFQFQPDGNVEKQCKKKRCILEVQDALAQAQQSHSSAICVHEKLDCYAGNNLCFLKTTSPTKRSGVGFRVQWLLTCFPIVPEHNPDTIATVSRRNGARQLGGEDQSDYVRLNMCFVGRMEV
ncbi:hypothetical protein Salat_1149500 [Sesamum alatum]|uniref:Uncharacterized protein n=1 Tax=Sesamum alatum TaxID=300844 RepID=A0AAE1YE24_9LAMI|nr:hypothetical protein Salat_1149500 [Sesamum alatum]